MLSSLSLSAQQYLDLQDVDAFIFPWQIPLKHKPEFDELVRKGYIVKSTNEVVGADGKNTGEQAGYRFAQEVIDKRGETMYL